MGEQILLGGHATTRRMRNFPPMPSRKSFRPMLDIYDGVSMCWCVCVYLYVGVNAPQWAWQGVSVCVRALIFTVTAVAARLRISSAFDSGDRHLVLIYGTFAHFMFISFAPMEAPPTHPGSPSPREGYAPVSTASGFKIAG